MCTGLPSYLYNGTLKTMSVNLQKHPPDAWIHPKNSMILQLRATELTRCSVHPAGYTLRFPRVVRVRDDKPWQDAWTLTELRAMIKVKIVCHCNDFISNIFTIIVTGWGLCAEGHEASRDERRYSRELQSTEKLSTGCYESRREIPGRQGQ